MPTSKPSLLLHVCCAPCSTHVAEVLKGPYEVTGYFYNPNIHPQAEYKTRRDEIRGYAEKIGLRCLFGAYDVDRWFEAVKGHEEDPEGGDRCRICYRMRLKETARFARENSFDYFTTTLSISPRKKAEMINRIGEEVAREYGVGFHAADFKKKDGFKKSVEMSKRFGLYRQNYCGCIYSRRRGESKNVTGSNPAQEHLAS